MQRALRQVAMERRRREPQWRSGVHRSLQLEPLPLFSTMVLPLLHVTLEIAMGTADRYDGSCFCGEVKFEVTGDPVAMGYCHCESCRHWSAGPVNAFTLWNPQALKITAGEASIGTYHKTDSSYRKWCTKCGGHLFTDHPAWNLVDVYAALIPKLRFEPGVHVHYRETVLRIHDGKPKMKDIPAEMGGSGVALPE